MRRCQRWLRLADIPPHQPCRCCQPGVHCLAGMGAAGLIGHIVNVNECIDINIAVRIQIYEWDQREKWLCDHFGIQLKFCAMLWLWSPRHYRLCIFKMCSTCWCVSACAVHDKGAWQGQCQCCRCGVAWDVRMQRENGGREQPEH